MPGSTTAILLGCVKTKLNHPASAVRRQLEDWVDTFEDFAITVETVVDLGDGVVYSVFRQERRLTGSASVVEERAAMICEWINGKIARLISRQDIGAARALAERLAESRG